MMMNTMVMNMMMMMKLLVFRNNNIVHSIYRIHPPIHQYPCIVTHLPSTQVSHTLQFVSYMDHPLQCMTQEHHEHYN